MRMTNSSTENILQAFASEAWAIMPEKLDAVLEFLSLRASGFRFEPHEIDARLGTTAIERAERSAAARANGGRRMVATAPAAGSTAQPGHIAVIPLYGVIAHRMRMVQDVSGPGGTSCEGFLQAFQEALGDDDVGAIVIDTDSPGGSVTGVEETRRQVFQARGQKPIKSVANGLMASAAYYIASAADEVIVSPSSDVGSIGVYATHVDKTKRNEQLGLTVSVIRAGRYKAEGHPDETLGDEARAYLQQRVVECYDMFVDAVAEHRGATATDVREGFGQGRAVGARQAVTERLADRVGTLDDVLRELGASLGGGGGARSSAPARRRATVERARLDLLELAPDRS